MSSTGYQNFICNSCSAVNDGQWHHVAIVVDRTINKMISFIDGVEQPPLNISAIVGSLNNTVQLQIGGHIDNSSSYFIGNMDEIRLWNTALSIYEVNANMFKSEPVGSVLAASWNLNESSGNNAQDFSSNANHGTLVNFETADRENVLGCSCGSPNTVMYFSTQADVNNFPSLNCSHILSDVIIYGNDIVDLTPLSSIKRIEGLLNIERNHMLISLQGLENLKYVGGAFSILVNTSLINLDGLSNLAMTNHIFTIGNNISLENITGLSQLKNIRGLVGVHNNPLITDLNGLIGLKNLLSDLYIFNNQNLSSLNGLNNLQSIYGYLSIDQNYALESLSALSSLTKINNFCTISQNTQLSSLEGLENLQSVIGNLEIVNNPQLSSCCGIYNLLNETLPLGVTGSINITNNGSINCDGESNVSAGKIVVNSICYDDLSTALNSGNLSDVVFINFDYNTEYVITILPGKTITMKNGVSFFNNHCLTNNGIINLSGTGVFMNNATYKGSGSVFGNFVNKGTIMPGQ